MLTLRSILFLCITRVATTVLVFVLIVLYEREIAVYMIRTNYSLLHNKEACSVEAGCLLQRITLPCVFSVIVLLSWLVDLFFIDAYVLAIQLK